MNIETIAVHGAGGCDPQTGAIATPIITAKNGAFRGIEDPIKIEYCRTQNPTRETLEKTVAELEGGSNAFAFSSGIAAINCVFQTLGRGDHVVFSKKLYAGSIRLCDLILSKFLEIDFVDPINTKSLKKAIKQNTKYIFIETPTNPLLEIVDLEAIKDISSSAGVPFIVDNTFATPCLLRPFEYGAETIIHSTSKYLGGHNDLVGGVIVTRNKGLAENLKLYAKTLGATPSPYDVYNTIRGIKTLALRVKKHCENAQIIAEFLAGNADVSRVYYPGLTSHPGHETAKKQMKGFGGVVSFEVKGDYKKFAKNIADNAPPIYLAESLGGVESLLTHPATMSHAYLTKKQRAEIGIKDNLFRLSPGIENSEDIIAKLKAALYSS
ncbi:aminotransferase class I/II-fold pyridoxal phosphate-dependent enzyme [Candidatus Woesearchaeota archaeon]|nr:aminotransferase class I/II-fold pyridoxal phosphate-dependent enzyme [Candidatus Woesearchaeota archaeon]